MNKFSVDCVVVDNLCHFREVPCEPLLEPHTERIDVFVQLLNKGNSLDDWLILSVDILSTSCAGITMAETELSSFDVVFVYL